MPVHPLQSYFTEKNLTTFSVKEWKAIFSEQLSGLYSTAPYSLNPEFLFRARINFDKKKKVDFFKKTKELWSPPKNIITEQDRCSAKGQNLLYCSTNPTTTIFEMKPPTGTEITIIRYKILSEIGLLGAVGVKEIMKINDSYKAVFCNHFKKVPPSSEMIDDILSDIFKLRAKHTKTFPLYNLTNAVSQIFMNKQKTSGKKNDHTAESLIGLVYPSVETEKILGMNMVMNPQKVKNILIPVVAYKYRILERHDDHHYDILLTHQTRAINRTGELIWGLKYGNEIEHITDLELH